MKPSNSKQIKRSVFLFVALFLGLVVLVGSSSWTYLGDRLNVQRAQLEDQASERQRLLDSIAGLQTKLEARDAEVRKLLKDMAARLNGKTAPDADFLLSFLQGAQANATKGAALNGYLKNARIPEPAALSPAGVKALEAGRQVLASAANAMIALEKSKTSAKGKPVSPSVAVAPVQQQPTSFSVSSTSVAVDGRMGILRDMARAGLGKMDLPNAEAVSPSALKKGALVGWNDARVEALIASYRDIAIYIELHQGR